MGRNDSCFCGSGLNQERCDKMQKWEKDLNKGLEDLIKTLGYSLKNFFVGVFYGAKKLKQKKFLIGFLISMIIPIVWIVSKSSFLKIENTLGRYLIYYLGLISPLLYLKIISGLSKNKEYSKKFKQINFYGLDNELPFLVEKQTDEFGLISLKFKAKIPLDKWRGNINNLEVMLDLTIVGIEPTNKKDIVILKTIPGNVEIPAMIRWNDEYIKSEDGVVTIGKNAIKEIIVDLNKTPHVLSAGETGSGKSVTLRTMLWQLISQGCRAYMIDFKGGVEFGKAYEKYGQVITEKEDALKVFEMLVAENKLRLDLFRDLEVKNLKEYNKKTKSNLCRIAVVIDEVAELLDKTGLVKEDKEILAKIEKELSTLARLSRATGINLLLGVQRPDAKVITGQIKSNVPVRICGRFADNAASEIVLSNTKAKDLPDRKGRFLFKAGADTTEFQAYYFDDEKDLKELKVIQGDLLIESQNYKKTDSDNLTTDNTYDSNSDLLDLDTLDIQNEEIEAIVETKDENYCDNSKYSNWNHNET